VIRENKDIELTTLTVGDANGQSYTAEFYLKLTPFANRKASTTDVKNDVREKMKAFAFASPKVKDVDFIGAGQRPFVVNIRGQNLEEIRKVGEKLFAKLKQHPGVQDPEYTDKPGLPEFQMQVNTKKAQAYGVTPALVGAELRAQVEGVTPAKFRLNGVEYDIRVRMQDDQRNLEAAFNSVKVSNLNGRLVKITDFASAKKEVGYATINRENRARYVSIEADITPGGVGMGGVIADIDKMFSNKEIELPNGASYRFVGQAENFQELGNSILLAGLLGIIFIYLTGVLNITLYNIKSGVLKK
jgi:HAE1 family hydrophobic/amphiphilic exporter-1